MAFAPGGRWACTGSSDGTTRFWDTATGDELARLISLDKGQDWLVVTPEGLFDGHPSMFVTSSDATDPNKNVVYRIGADGSFLGAYIKFSDPTNILACPVP